MKKYAIALLIIALVTSFILPASAITVKEATEYVGKTVVVNITDDNWNVSGRETYVGTVLQVYYYAHSSKKEGNYMSLLLGFESGSKFGGRFITYYSNQVVNQINIKRIIDIFELEDITKGGIGETK